MNPSAREALEAERKECAACIYFAHHSSYPCDKHTFVLHGIELAERADLERVVLLRDKIAAQKGYYEWLPAPERRKISCSDAMDYAIELLCAAFPEVKEGE
jgi:hypothetical protein